jgi:hypothetical protein
VNEKTNRSALSRIAALRARARQHLENRAVKATRAPRAIYRAHFGALNASRRVNPPADTDPPVTPATRLSFFTDPEPRGRNLVRRLGWHVAV